MRFPGARNAPAAARPGWWQGLVCLDIRGPPHTTRTSRRANGATHLQQLGLVHVAGGLAGQQVVLEHAKEGEVEATGVEQRLQLELGK